MRILQRNVHASIEPKRHVNIYDIQDSGDDIRNWLSTIRGGDTIQLIMRAEFPAWANFCYEAELKIDGQTKLENDSNSGFALSAAWKGSSSYYQPLGRLEREIRVLGIDAGSFNDPVSCYLQTISLDDDSRDSYEALSYCWGDLLPDKTIKLRVPSPQTELPDEYDVAVTSTVYDAVRRLRPQNGPARLLWVDFLCVNQGDLEERAIQVSIMPKIYSRAECVHIWLGASSPDTEHVFEDVRRVASRYENDNDPRVASHDKDDIEGLHAPLVPEQLVPFIENWRRCDFAWFKRTWVLQEVANAASAVVHCGGDTLAWPIILRLSDCIIKAKRRTSLFRYAIMPPIFSSLFTLDNGRGAVSMQRQHTTGLSVLDVLVAGHDLDASDPRDKIFALLQFGTDTGDVEQLPDQIRPNYSKPVVQVFADFTRWWIATHKSLRILSAVHTARDRGWEQMSSGAPADLDALGHPTWCFWYGGTASWAKATLSLSPDAPYRATGESVPDMDLLTADADRPLSALRLRGHRICTIASIEPFPLYGAGPPREIRDAFVRLFDPVGDLKTWIWGREEQTIRHDRFRDIRMIFQEHFDAHVQYVRESGGALPCYSPCYFRSAAVNRDGGQRNSELEGSEGEGDIKIGLCPHNAKVGDLVVVLYGGRVPYLLREIRRDGPERGDQGRRSITSESEKDLGYSPSGSYGFIGECFLHGYMYGAALEKVAAQGLGSEVFGLV